MDAIYDVLRKTLEGGIKLTEEQWERVFTCYKPKKTKRNEIVLEKGKVSQHLYFVAKGCLRIFLTDEDGQEATRFLIFEGRFGTAFPSFRLRQPSAASIQSVEPSELLMISYDDYQLLMDTIPGWERMSRLGIELDYIDAIVRIESLITMDAGERYEILMKQNPKLIQRLPSKIVADYLGISQETLSRLKSRKPKSSRSRVN
ncbi:MAG TPA: Crp/Fnr family transcriptional regulator [Mucilaginibacter sp.]|nr:Crp/Fnr family transcriptional regulator [Mucilaginibacter sp.]